MQLLSFWAANVLLSALLTSSILALLGALLVRRFTPPPHPVLLRVFLTLIAFSLLGFVVGDLTGVSREAAVGTVIPAVLTLIGGAAAYVVGSKGVKAQIIVSAMLTCFTLALLIGSIFGLRLRIEYLAEIEQPDRLRQRDLALEHNKRAVEIKRLENYIDVLKIQRDLAEAEKLNLSKFNNSYEAKMKDDKSPPDKKDASAPPGESAAKKARETPP
jgi:hypothetical protein